MSENSAGVKRRLLLGDDCFLDKPHSLAEAKFTWNSWVLLIGIFTDLYASGVQSHSIRCYFLFALIGSKDLIGERLVIWEVQRAFLETDSERKSNS